MTLCCGSEQKTNYCSHCGKKLNNSKLRALLEYLSVMKIRQAKELEKRRNWLECRLRIDPENCRGFAKRVESTEKNLDKWTAWESHLISAIELIENIQNQEKPNDRKD